VLLDVLLGKDEHAAGTATGIVDAHVLPGVEKADHEADDIAWGVELAALFAGGVGELADEVFVGGAEEVGELEVVVAEAILVEVLDEVAEFLVGDAGAADGAIEVDVLEDPFEGGLSSSRAPRALFSSLPTSVWTSLKMWLQRAAGGTKKVSL
jgi:hypothetical protein